MVFNYVRIKMLRENAKVPELATDGSACSDVFAAIDKEVFIYPHQTKFIPLGFATSFDPNFVILVFSRSGLASKDDLAPANKVAVIDSDYRGEWVLPIHNHGNCDRKIEPGQKIAQIMLLPKYMIKFIPVDELPNSIRGTGGFGSTGR